jgi:hypothetical protein
LEHRGKDERNRQDAKTPRLIGDEPQRRKERKVRKDLLGFHRRVTMSGAHYP